MALAVEGIDTHSQFDEFATLRHVEITRQVTAQGRAHYNHYGQQGREHCQQTSERHHHPQGQRQREDLATATLTDEHQTIAMTGHDSLIIFLLIQHPLPRTLLQDVFRQNEV